MHEYHYEYEGTKTEKREKEWKRNETNKTKKFYGATYRCATYIYGVVVPLLIYQ